jgi:NAD(P)-dependent dehydrogenase (short-subunit alcohol dehydrogenase family)
MVAIVTGANGVFGVHIVEGLLAAGKATICVARDKTKAEALVSQMRAKFPRVDCIYKLCDVSERGQVKQLAASLGDTPVDILVNNAAVTPRTRLETKDGIEQQWACNVLGYHWLMQELESHLLRPAQPPARVINVASAYAGGLDLSDPEFKRREYDPDAAYRASKQANRMLTRAWADRWPRDRIVALSCHPGLAASAVSKGLGFDLDGSAAAACAGAAEPLRLCADPAAPARSGGYFRDGRERECKFAADAGAVRQLMGVLESYP